MIWYGTFAHWPGLAKTEGGGEGASGAWVGAATGAGE